MSAAPPAGNGRRRSGRAGSPGRAKRRPDAERENLDLLCPVTAPEQDQELEETTEDETEEGPQHKYRG